MSQRHNTPGVAGYALAVLVSVLTYAALLVALLSFPPLLQFPPRTWLSWLWFLLAVLPYVALAGLPVGAAGAVVVHLCCRRVRSQLVHVLAAALAGLVAGALFWGAAGENPLGATTWLLMLAAATGRVAVIPLVHRRSHNRSSVELSGPVATSAAGSSRPWVIGAMLLCAVGALGVVASASARVVSRAPGMADVFALNPGPVTVAWAAATAAATVVGLLVLRASVRHGWPWLVFVGVMLAIVIMYLPLAPRTILRPAPLAGSGHLPVAGWATALITGGTQLVLLGVLGAGVWLIRIRARGAGAVLIGASLGAQLFGASMSLTARFWALDLSPEYWWHVTSWARMVVLSLLDLAAVGGAVLVIVLHRAYAGRVELVESAGAGEGAKAGQGAGPSEEAAAGRAAEAAGVGAGVGARWRVTFAGCVAALALVPIVVLAGGSGVPRGPADSGGGVFAQDVTSTIGASAAILGVTVILAAVGGRQALAATLVTALAVVGVAVPFHVLSVLARSLFASLLGVSPVGARPLFAGFLGVWFLVAVGVVLGGVAAFTRWRWRLAAGGYATAGVLLAVATAVGTPPISGLLLVLLAAAVTATVAALGLSLCERLAAPAVLGPLAAGTILGGYGVLTWVQFGRGEPGVEELELRLPSFTWCCSSWPPPR